MSNDIENRFKYEEGLRNLTHAWLRQSVTAGDRGIADRMAAISRVESVAAQQIIFDQGAGSTDFYLVLVGAVRIETNGRPGPIRRAGDHFGEMTLIDLSMRRSATVRAIEETVIARVTERDFAALAQENPLMWRALAVEIGQRLRQRLIDVPSRNEKPFVFVGSSREGLAVANAIKAGIESEGSDVRIWTAGVFGASETTIESLENTVRAADFAVLLFTPDDALRTRGRKHFVPRDNVIFELGLFMGALGRSRVFVVQPRVGLRTPLSSLLGRILDRINPKKFKVPTDLLNVTAITYEDGAPADLAARLAPACDQIKKAMARLETK